MAEAAGADVAERRAHRHRVSFAYKDYGQGARVREMTLSVEKFIRRFLLLVLPESFVRIRYWEWLTDQPVAEIETSSVLAPEDWRARLTRLTGRDPTVCLVYGRGHLRLVEELPGVPFDAPERSPP
jgi:Putative transposase.